MIYASVESTAPDPNQRDGRQPSDVQQVLDGLLHAVLENDHVVEAHVFSDYGALPARTLALQRYADEKRIAWKHLALLPKLSDENEYVFVSSGLSFGSVCEARAATGQLAFPVFSMMQPLEGYDGLGRLALNLLQTEPCDVWMVATASTRAAITSALETVTAWIGNHSARRQQPWIEQVPAAVDTATFRPRDKRQCRDAVGLPTDNPIVLCRGRMGRGRKTDMEPVLVAHQQVITDHRDAVLVITGADDPSYAAELNRLVRDLEIVSNVRILPDVASHAKPLLWAAADVFISVDDNVQGTDWLSVLEAMASGVAVIASDWNGGREMIEDDVTGMLVPTYWNPIAGAMLSWLSVGESGCQFVADRTVYDIRQLSEALQVLLFDSERRQRIGSSGRRYVEVNNAPAKVAGTAARVWRRQLAELAKHRCETRKPPSDYNRIYQHYGSTELNLNLLLTVSLRGKRLVGDELRAPDTRRMPALLRTDACIILEAAKRGPVSVRDCVSRGSEFAFEAAVWLLKKGYVYPNVASTNDVP